MKGSREAISVALFNLLNNYQPLTTLCKTVTRKVKLWTEVPEAQKPWLMLFKGGPETEGFFQPQNQQIGLTRYRIHYNLWLYLTSDPASTVIAETAINNIADQIDAAFQSTSGLATSFGERQTLDGLVNNAWIDGGSEWGREFEDTNITVFWRIAVEVGI